MFINILQKTNLTPAQAEILNFLYQNKEAKASEIAKKIGKSRTIVYSEIIELINLRLVEKKEKPRQVAIFNATHPSALIGLMECKELGQKKEKEDFFNTLPKIISSFNLNNNRPGVRFFEGVDGLKKIYDEIIDTGVELFLFRTAYEPVYNNKIAPIVDEFIKRRVRKKIKINAIIPSDVNDPTKDTQWLMRRYNIDKKFYTSPVEIDIFGDKIAILSFGEDLIGVIIESRQIAKSLKEIFFLATFASKS